MTYGAWEIVGRDHHKLRFDKTVGDALRDLIVKRFKHRAIKEIEARWKLDNKTARNFVTRGCLSPTTLTKAAHAERWALWMALGEELFEETYADHLARVVDERERAVQRAAADKDQLLSLEARAAAVVALLDRPAAAPKGNRTRRTWAAVDGQGVGEAERLNQAGEGR